MSDSIFTKFAKKLAANGSPMPKEWMQKVTERSEVLEKAFDLLEDKPEEAGWLLTEKSREGLFNVPFDPVIPILEARAKHEAYVKGRGNEEQREWFRTIRLSLFMSATNTLIDIEAGVFQYSKDNPKDEEARAAWNNVSLMLQYSLYHLLEIAKEMNKDVGPNFKKDWEKYGFHKLNNYQGIDPIVAELCPPHHIWKKYLLNGSAYDLTK